MKKLLLMMLGALTMMSCVHINVSKTVDMTQSFSMRPFEIVEINGSPSVYYEQGDSFSVRLVGDEDQVQRINLTSENGRLVIRPREKLFDFGGIGDVSVYVTSPDLIGVVLVGSGSFDCTQPLDTDTLQLVLRGSGDIKFGPVVCDCVKTDVTGSGDVELKQVKTQWAYLSVVGSGEIDASLEKAHYTDVQLKGSGDIKVNFNDCRRANCVIQGSGDVELSGSLDNLNYNVLGSGDLDKKHLILKPS